MRPCWLHSLHASRDSRRLAEASLEPLDVPVWLDLRFLPADSWLAIMSAPALAMGTTGTAVRADGSHGSVIHSCF